MFTFDFVKSVQRIYLEATRYIGGTRYLNIHSERRSCRPAMECRGQTMRRTIVIISVLFRVSILCHSLQNDTVHVGVILDFNSWIGRVAKIAIELAAEDVNKDSQLLNGARMVLHVQDGQTNPLLGASAALDLLKEEAVAIIGPQTSEVAEFISHIGDAAHVPIVSFSATSPMLSNHRFPYFARTAHSDALQMMAIASLVKAYSWRKIVVVYHNDDFGSGAVSSLSDALRAVGSEIEYRSAISPTASREAIREELYKLNNMQSRVFVAHMNSRLGPRLFAEARNIGMMDADYVWITTDAYTSLWDVLLNASTMSSMQGLLGVKSYIPSSDKLKDFNKRWKRQFRIENPDEDKTELNQYGLLAYDTVWLIGRAIGKLGANTSLNFLKPSSPPVVVGNAKDLTEIKVFEQGHQLLQEILATNFTGLSGSLQMNDGEISDSTYEIVNVAGQSYRVVGYWTDKTQKLSRALPSESLPSPGHINIEEGLGAVIWPGGSTQFPRGWVTPTIGKKLKIGVPAKARFKEFVTVTYNKNRNGSTVDGFCKDVFEAVLRRLDYALPYDFIPYPDDNYTNLVYQVYLKKFDAVVGDTTILASRSKFVDFTQPYTESGLVMVVSTKTDEANNAWAFWTPFTPGLWATTAAFFISTGIVVWLLEHKINPVFRGAPGEQAVTLLWFSFSTLTFSQREPIISCLSRLVIIIWLFVVLIITSSYTASLTSILTVQQITPTVTSVDSLKESGLPVGYQDGSFVGGYLQDKFGIDETNLRKYSNPKDYADALSKGPNKGGVAAIFDEIPYVRLFLSQYCGYTMVGPTYRTGGLGFVFPKGSPLVSDISTAVLSLSEDKKMQDIESIYFNTTLCTNPGAKVDSNRLSMDSFWGLYLITGSASMLALIIFFWRLLYNFKRDPSVSTEEKSMKSVKSVKSLAMYFDKEEVSIPTSEQKRLSGTDSPSSTPGFESSPQGNPLSRSTSSSFDSEKSLSIEEAGGHHHSDAADQHVSA